MKGMLRVILLAAALGPLVGSASAQPMHGASPLAMLGAVKSQLNLNTSQQQQWDNAVALSATAHSAVRASVDQRRAALQAELAKAEPDFASVAAAGDTAHDQIASLHRQARDAWLALYATFTPEQKGIARDAIKTRLAQIEARRATRHQAPSR
jgi:hypothetical protein